MFEDLFGMSCVLQIQKKFKNEKVETSEKSLNQTKFSHVVGTGKTNEIGKFLSDLQNTLNLEILEFVDVRCVIDPVTVLEQINMCI